MMGLGKGSHPGPWPYKCIFALKNTARFRMQADGDVKIGSYGKKVYCNEGQDGSARACCGREE